MSSSTRRVIVTVLMLAAHAPLAPAQTATTTILRRADAAATIADRLQNAATRLDLQTSHPAVVRFLDGPFDQAPPAEAELFAALTRSGGPRNLSRGGAVAAGGLFGQLPSEAALLNGLTDYLIERAKDELVLAYLANLQKQLDAAPFIGAAFPSTVLVIRSTSTTNANALLPAFRSAAARDFDALPEHFVAVADSFYGNPAAVTTILASAATADEKLRQLREKRLALYLIGYLTNVARKGKPADSVIAAFSERLRLRDRLRPTLEAIGVVAEPVRRIRSGTDPAVALSSLAQLRAPDVADARLRLALGTLGIASREFADSRGKLRDELNDLRKQEYFMAFFAGDLREVADDASVDTPVHLRQLFKKGYEPVLSLIDQIGVAQEALQKIRDARSDPDTRITTGDAFAQASQVLFSLLDNMRRVVPDRLADERWLTNRDQLQRLLGFLDPIEEISTALHAADYSRALMTTVTLFRVDSLIVPPRAMQIATFASSMASAKDARGVTAALEASALPVGSFRAKRTPLEGDEKVVSLTLNAYMGASGGAEIPIGQPGVATVGQMAVAAPVGFEVSWSARGGSLGFFMPLIDLGNLTMARFGSDTLQNDPKVGFSQVMAPGLYAVWGVTRSNPFTIGVGAQLAPGLRETKVTNLSVSTVRASLFLAFDLPLIRF
jgi:hypothetical protein